MPYEQRRADRLTTVARWERWHTRFGLVRVAIALSIPVIFWVGGWAAWPWAAAVGVVFLAFVAAHTRIIDARNRAQRAVDFYDRGLQRLRHEWPGHGDDGRRFAPSGPHLYADDLDIFGRGGAFELIGTCRTEAGQSTLAAWLLAPATTEVVRARQEAIRELTPQLDLRERLSVEGAVVGDRLHPDHLRRWAGAAPVLSSGVLRVLAALAPIVTIGAVVWRSNGGPGGVAELALIVQIGLALALRNRVLQVIHAVDSPSRDLDLLERTARVIEEGTFTSGRLQYLQQQLHTHTRASTAIRRLSQLVALLSSRRNVIFAPLSGLLMWATQLAFVVEDWRRRDGRAVSAWLDAIGEFEALSALAGYAAEHPTFVFPDMTDDATAHFSASALAHPLLPETAIANDVAIGGRDPVMWLVSGSNMSGKSTFLRAIGLTAVLAQMGAPVRATRCALSPLAIGASIRVLDSLQEGHSRFYAEILRLKHVVDLARASNGRMLFLLDEMLSGTNSHDRRHGAEGVLLGLTGMGAIGLATTHDLALGEIVTSMDRAAVQVHFSDVFEAGTLQFDYHLRPGPVRTSNALALMRSIGLEVAAQ
jgi:MutS domain V